MSKKRTKRENDDFPNKFQKLTNYFLPVQLNERIDKEESTSQEVVEQSSPCFIEKINSGTNKSTVSTPVNSDFSITDERNNYDENKLEVTNSNKLASFSNDNNDSGIL